MIADMQDKECLRHVLHAYGLSIEEISDGGGTAGRAWRVRASGGGYFVRLRGARTSAPERVAFDHGLRKHLAAQGYCTVAPLETRDGKTWVESEDGVYEAYPLVAGEPFSLEVLPKVRATTATALARFHDLAATYDGVCEALVPQFTSYPEPIPPRNRFDHPDAHREAVEFLVEAYATPSNRDDLLRARDHALEVGERYAAMYSGLRRGVTHGDYNCFNLLFAPSGEVVGLFDFDWAWREARLLDVAQGTFFFGTERRGDPDAASIWSLTRCPEFRLDTMLEFLRAYHACSPLTEAECRALPTCMLARWISWRMEGVMKVPEERRAEFFLYGFFEPFAWCDGEGEALTEGVLGG
jgi:Ser/Thr protein kinase RdoA (MazF antagonist)